MAKYAVYAIATASWKLGEYEAESKEAAIVLARDDQQAEYYKSLCHQCSDVDLSDVTEEQAELIDG